MISQCLIIMIITQSSFSKAFKLDSHKKMSLKSFFNDRKIFSSLLTDVPYNDV